MQLHAHYGLSQFYVIYYSTSAAYQLFLSVSCSVLCSQPVKVSLVLAHSEAARPIVGVRVCIRRAAL
jgi:hypothetical protein